MVGWIAVGITAFNFLVNIGVAIFFMAKDARKSLGSHIDNLQENHMKKMIMDRR
jgi:hypothetical protein